MEELLMEIRILKKVMTESSESLKLRLENDETFDKDLSFLDEDITLGRVLFTIVKNLSHADLLNLSDKEMLQHIQKIQVIEKE